MIRIFVIVGVLVFVWYLFGDCIAKYLTGTDTFNDDQNKDVSISDAKKAIRKALDVDDRLNEQEASERRAELRAEVGQWYDMAEDSNEEK